MFTLEESALLKRMIHFVLVGVCLVIGAAVAYFLFR